MAVTIRSERPSDARPLRELITAAFETAAHQSGTEQHIVEALRKAAALTVSLVAEVNGEIVGQVAVSAVEISDGTSGWFGFRAVPDLVLPGAPAEYFQALKFGPAFPAGTVTYHDAIATEG